MKIYSCDGLASYVVLGWILTSVVQAQEVQQQSSTGSTSESKTILANQTSPYTIVWGSYLLRPELSVTNQYDSNIFALRDDEVDDSIMIYEPSLLLTSNWAQHLVELNIGGELGRYHQHPLEDYDDYWLNFKGRYDISEKTNFFGGLSHISDHEERGTPDVVDTIPTTFDSDQAYVGFAHRVGNYKYRIGATFEHLDYDDAGPVNNDDRDRDISGLGLRVNYLYAPDREFFAQAILDKRDYEVDFDDNGFERDSEGHRLAVGFKGRYSNRLSAETYIERLYQENDDDRFTDALTDLSD